MLFKILDLVFWLLLLAVLLAITALLLPCLLAFIVSPVGIIFIMYLLGRVTRF